MYSVRLSISSFNDSPLAVTQHLELSEISEFKPMPPIRFMSAVKEDEKVAQLFGKLEIGYR
jgi:hypothetical protein